MPQYSVPSDQLGRRAIRQRQRQREDVVAHHPDLRVLDDEAAAGDVRIRNQQAGLNHVAVDGDRLPAQPPALRIDQLIS